MKNRSLVLVGMIVTLLAGILNGQSPVEIRAAASTAVSGWTQMASPNGDALWVSPATSLTSSDIERAEAASSPDAGPGINIVLTDSGAAKMAALSAAQLNRPIALLLDGHVIWAPVIRSTVSKVGRLTGGDGGLTQAQIDRLLASFKTR